MQAHFLRGSIPSRESVGRRSFTRRSFLSKLSSRASRSISFAKLPKVLRPFPPCSARVSSSFSVNCSLASPFYASKASRFHVNSCLERAEEEFRRRPKDEERQVLDSRRDRTRGRASFLITCPLCFPPRRCARAEFWRSNDADFHSRFLLPRVAKTSEMKKTPGLGQKTRAHTHTQFQRGFN